MSARVALSISLAVLWVFVGPGAYADQSEGKLMRGDDAGGSELTGAPVRDARDQSDSENPVPASEQGRTIAGENGDVKPVSEAEEARLRERVDGRWQALIQGEFQSAYEYELPSFRERTSFEQYRGRFGQAVEWHMVTITDVSYDSPEVARVRVAIDHSFTPSSGAQVVRTVSGMRETWLKRDGQWWHGGPG